MAACNISQDKIKQTISFHGHSCPGIGIGIRAAELALERFNGYDLEVLVAVVETDMCGVDAIQFLTGCTFGKGNLVHKDYGKMAFTFYNRKIGNGQGTDAEAQHCEGLRKKILQNYLNMDLSKMFILTEHEFPAPIPVKLFHSRCCDNCGETTMEIKTRRFDGHTLCIPCFEKVEQKP